MKVSSNLLKAIAIGVALGGSVTSCNLIEDVLSEEQVEVCNETCEAECTAHARKDGHSDYNCPACGLG